MVLHQADVSHHHVEDVLADGLGVAGELESLAAQKHYVHFPPMVLALPLLGLRLERQWCYLRNAALDHLDWL